MIIIKLTVILIMITLILLVIVTEAYNYSVMEENLCSKVKEVETAAHINSNYSQSWRLINNTTGQRASAKGQLKATKS